MPARKSRRAPSPTVTPPAAVSKTDTTRSTEPVDTLTLKATHDVAAIGAQHEKAQGWLTARSAAGSGRIALEDPENLLTLQLVAAVRKSAESLGIDLEIVGPSGALPDNIRFTSSPEVSA